MSPPFAAIARLRIAAKGNPEAAIGAIDMNITRPNTRGYRPGLLQIITLSLARQAIGSVIRYANSLFFGFVGNHG